MMKMPKLFAVAIAAVFMLACIQGAHAAGGPLPAIKDPVFPWISDGNPITVDQAKESIRVFIGDMSLEPVYESTQENLFEHYYLFNLDTVTFWVNTHTGTVEIISFNDRMPKSRTIAISHDEALAKAKEFAGGYNGFSKKTWHLVTDTLTLNLNNSSSYFFLFQEERDDILFTNVVFVEVNPESGEICYYDSMDRTGEPVNLTPTVGKEEAARIAESVISNKKYTLDPASGHLAVLQERTGLKSQRLVWIFTVRDSAGADPLPWDVFIDATDGKESPPGSFTFQILIDQLGYQLPRV
jgi:hypothetical protein